VRRIRSRRRATRTGFTLLELLATLAIGSVVLTATAGLVRNVAMSFDLGTRGAANVERLLLAVERLGGDFAAARFVSRPMNKGGGALFLGEPKRVLFVSAGRTASGADEEVVSLEVQEAGDMTRLVRRRAAWGGPIVGFEDVQPADPVVLLEGPLVIRFAYTDEPSAQGFGWAETWSARRLPRYVRLLLRDRDTGTDLLPTAPFVIRADAPAACAFPGASGTCTAPASAQPGGVSASTPSAQ
jgi:prepilin-type N-terminal cleavage/methylation domain-containing protein